MFLFLIIQEMIIKGELMFRRIFQHLLSAGKEILATDLRISHSCDEICNRFSIENIVDAFGRYKNYLLLIQTRSYPKEYFVPS